MDKYGTVSGEEDAPTDKKEESTPTLWDLLDRQKKRNADSAKKGSVGAGGGPSKHKAGKKG